MKFIIAITNRDEKNLSTTLRQIVEEFSFNQQELLHTPDCLAMLKVSVWAKYRTKTLCFEDFSAATEEEIDLYVREMAENRCDIAVVAFSDNPRSREALGLAAEENEYLVLEGQQLGHHNPSKIFKEVTILREDFAAVLRNVFASAIRKFIYQLATDYCNKDASTITRVVKNPMLA